MLGVQDPVAIIGARGRTIDEGTSNFLLSVVRGVKPRDELEAMLAVQMGAVHQATMMMARRLNQVDNIAQQDSAERALNKLARTYAIQMEVLKRYRTGGQQKVTVEHVTAHQGGQAIVGAVKHGGGRVPVKNDDNPMSKAHAAPRCTATSKRTGNTVQGPSGHRMARLSLSWRGWRTR